LKVDGGPAKKVGKQHDWNDLEILAQGNRVRVVVNGTQVVDWRDPDPDRIKEKAPSACNYTPTPFLRKFISRTWS
jgi:hypothetical protein